MKNVEVPNVDHQRSFSLFIKRRKFESDNKWNRKHSVILVPAQVFGSGFEVHEAALQGGHTASTPGSRLRLTPSLNS